MSAPVVSAGGSQSVNDGSVLILTASYSTGGAPIKSHGWVQTSGPDSIMTHPKGAITPVYEMSSGTYVFTFSATDTNNVTTSDTATITVSHTTGPVYPPKYPYPYNFL